MTFGGHGRGDGYEELYVLSETEPTDSNAIAANPNGVVIAIVVRQMPLGSHGIGKLAEI